MPFAARRNGRVSYTIVGPSDPAVPRRPATPTLLVVARGAVSIRLPLSTRSGSRVAMAASGLEEPRYGWVATADADLPSCRTGISSAAPRPLLGAAQPRISLLVADHHARRRPQTGRSHRNRVTNV
jgi:hypothetical protein